MPGRLRSRPFLMLPRGIAGRNAGCSVARGLALLESYSPADRSLDPTLSGQDTPTTPRLRRAVSYLRLGVQCVHSSTPQVSGYGCGGPITNAALEPNRKDRGNMRVDGREITVSGSLLQPLTRRTNDILRLVLAARVPGGRDHQFADHPQRVGRARRDPSPRSSGC